MEPLLFLCHRLPYPPDKGDKIRSFHILRELARRYRVHLGTFVDDPADLAHLPALEALCVSVHAVPISPRLRRLASLPALWRGEALGLAYYRDAGLAAWVAALQRAERPQRVLVFSSTMAQYVTGDDWAAVRRVIDFVDVDSEKWAEYAARKPWPMSLVYAREARCLRAFETAIAARFDASVFVTDAEAALFCASTHTTAARVHAVENGVDLHYFAPDAARPSPYPAAVPVAVFTGAMDYWANVDAVNWFAHAIWPAVRRALPRAEFWIVGTRPGPVVQQLANLPGVVVTGRVPDTRPYLQHARVAVAPLRIARGVQNKVLEAMAMGLAVVATPAACTGLGASAPPCAQATDDAAQFAARVVNALADPAAAAGRHYVDRHHHWPRNLARLADLLEVA